MNEGFREFLFTIRKTSEKFRRKFISQCFKDKVLCRVSHALLFINPHTPIHRYPRRPTTHYFFSISANFLKFGGSCHAFS